MRWVLLVALVLSACSKGAEADLQYIKQARSVAAEWALVNAQAAGGKVTATYVGSMHHWIRQELQSAAAGLSEPNSPYGQEIEGLLREPDDSRPEVLRAHSDKLQQIEDQLESA